MRTQVTVKLKESQRVSPNAWRLNINSNYEPSGKRDVTQQVVSWISPTQQDAANSFVEDEIEWFELKNV